MEQPQLSSFGLTEPEFERWRHVHEGVASKLFSRIGAGLLGLGYLCGAFVALRVEGVSWWAKPGLVFMLSIVGGTMAFLAVISVGAVLLLLGFILSAFVPSLARYRAFRKAQEEYRAWKVRTLRTFWMNLSGRAFERELAALFAEKGYGVELTPVSGDNGIDIVLRCEGRTTIVQCKATRKPVGPGVARELYGALVASGADDAILAATGGVSAGTREFVRGKRIRVLTITEIVAWHSDELDKAPASRHREAG